MWYLIGMDERLPTRANCRPEILKLLGDYVTLRVVDALRAGELRFTQLKGSLDDVNSVTLSNRLKRMESVGLVGRKVATVDRQSVTYSLTARGKGLLPVLREMRNFALRHLDYRP